VAIIFIVLIIVISYGLFFYLQNNTESNIRNSLFEQQKQRQIGSTLALSQHIGSDLDSIMARLQDLANSGFLKQGDLLSSNTTKKLMEQMYVQMTCHTNQYVCMTSAGSKADALYSAYQSL